MKVCTKCGDEKPLDDFARKRDTKDGRKSHCKECGKIDYQNKCEVFLQKWTQEANGYKRCYRCRLVKTLDEFYPSPASKFGRRSDCKECAKALKLIHKNPKRDRDRRLYQKARSYGFDVETYLKKISEGCEVCGSSIAIGMDHCHATGKTRGPLCTNCNCAIGHAKDDPEWLRKLASYLDRWQRSM